LRNLEKDIVIWKKRGRQAGYRRDERQAIETSVAKKPGAET
jgi:hypothetical protein